MRYLILAVIAVIIVFFVLDYRNKSEIDSLKKQIRFHVEQAKEARHKADSLENELDIFIGHYLRLQASYRIATENKNKWEKLYNEERKRKTGILTDVAYDSMLNSLYPR